MQLTVNGETSEVESEPDRSLLMVLREEMALLAAKPGCGEGACGACTVLVDGRPIHACSRPIAQVAGQTVDTLEGLREERVWKAAIDAFTEIRAFQCGYCTPGMVVAAGALLRDNRSPTDTDIAAAMNGNICRCGTYPRIVRAVHAAAEALAASDRRPKEGDATSGPTPDGADARFADHPAQPWDLAEVGARDYFERLGDGLVVVLTADETERVNEHLGGAWSTEGGAWLHVAPDGHVTAFIGKVDVGQDNHTELRAIVTRALGIASEQVELLMGDTDFSPYDMGTFGSRSTEDAGGVLQAVAAAARAWLAANEGALEETRQVVYARADAAANSAVHQQVSPVNADRHNARTIAEGRQHYTSDLALPDMLYGRVLRPPTYGAELAAADVAAAAARPEVVAVHQGSFVGVAAPTPFAASQALAAVESEWRAGPPLEEDTLADYLRAHPDEEKGWGGAFRHEIGDVDSALGAAAHTVTATYTTAYIAHVPLETRCALAAWDGDRVTVWTGTQRPFGVREQVAAELALDEAQVRVIVPPTGGGYGGKHSVEAAVEAARLARAAGRPVKVRWNRAEEFSAAYFRPAALIDVRAGLDPSGRLVAWQFKNTNSGPMGIQPPYAIDHQLLEYQPAASPFRQGSYRALAATANNFARESMIDELVHVVGGDPLDFRLGQLTDERLAGILTAAADGIGWQRRERATGGRAMGLACGLEKGSRIAAAVDVEVAGDGGVKVKRIVTAFDCGAVIDPDNLRNQVEGATVMGLGGALFEAVHFAGGRLTNGSMTDYRVPRFEDVPPIDVILIEPPGQPSAGAGETPIIAIAPAIANAIFAATGERRRALPLLAKT